ncbi:MAG: hypothetical protein H0W50_04815 [Parachlamydiaceae bacterium]|nr:hypothetical protein [Parachlamydiaceae bacterium]
MSLPVSPLYIIPRDQISLDESCPVCLEDVGSDGGRQWVAHKDASNSKFIHPWHKDCAVRTVREVSTVCLHRDVNLEVNSLLSTQQRFGATILKNLSGIALSAGFVGYIISATALLSLEESYSICGGEVFTTVFLCSKGLSAIGMFAGCITGLNTAIVVKRVAIRMMAEHDKNS